MDNSNVTSVVRDLINTCRDGEKGYKDAADHAKSPDLKSRFLRVSSERARLAQQLESELSKLGEQTGKDDGHVVGAVHRAWIDTKQALGAGDQAILDWLEQGDDYAKNKYEKALSADLPQNVAAVVREQAQVIFAGHDQIKALRDQKAA